MKTKNNVDMSTDTVGFLNGMSPDKLTRLINILSSLKKESPSALRSRLEAVYFPSERSSSEAKNYKKFLQKNEISILYMGNSFNFKVKELSSGDAAVIKINPEQNNSSDEVTALRSGELSDVLAPETVIRAFSSTSPCLVVQPFMICGDIEKHARTIADEDIRLESALSVYSQMANAMQKFQNAGYVFPDAKNTNWLLSDEDGHLKIQIADTKAIISAPNQRLSVTDRENLTTSENGTLWCSYYMVPPEFKLPNWILDSINGHSAKNKGKFRGKDYGGANAFEISVDAMHAYMLGKNLYQYLTLHDMQKNIIDNLGNLNSQAEDDYFDLEANEFVFSSYPIFNDAKGERLKNLIIATTRSPENSRMTLSEAAAELKDLMSKVAQLPSTAVEMGTGEIIDTQTEMPTDDSKPIVATKHRPLGGMLGAVQRFVGLKERLEPIVEERNSEHSNDDNDKKRLL